MRGDKETAIFLNAGVTPVSLALSRWLLDGREQFVLFCYYQLPAPTRSTKGSATL